MPSVVITLLGGTFSCLADNLRGLAKALFGVAAPFWISWSGRSGLTDRFPMPSTQRAGAVTSKTSRAGSWCRLEVG